MLQNQTTNVSVPRANGKGVMDSYFVEPEGAGPFPGIIVIHEIFGLNDHIRDVARQFAGQGMPRWQLICFPIATAWSACCRSCTA
jgi:hypothetical protein